MEPENSNDVRSAAPASPAEDCHIVIKIPKGKIKKFFKAILPIMLLLSLGLNCLLMHALCGSWRNSRFNSWRVMPCAPAQQFEIRSGNGSISIYEFDQRGMQKNIQEKVQEKIQEKFQKNMPRMKGYYNR